MKRKNPNLGQKSSTGYPALERLIETEDFKEVNEDFATAYGELEKIARQRSIKKAKDAKKAMKGIELTMNMLKELLSVKYRLQAQLEQSKNGKLRK